MIPKSKRPRRIGALLPPLLSFVLSGCALPPPSPPADPDAAWQQEVGWPLMPATKASAPASAPRR